MHSHCAAVDGDTHLQPGLLQTQLLLGRIKLRTNCLQLNGARRDLPHAKQRLSARILVQAWVSIHPRRLTGAMARGNNQPHLGACLAQGPMKFVPLSLRADACTKVVRSYP